MVIKFFILIEVFCETHKFILKIYDLMLLIKNLFSAPIVIVMDEGYILRENQNKNSKGSGKHGYDNNLDALRCILLGMLIYD